MIAFVGCVFTAIILLVNGENYYGDLLEARFSLSWGNDPNCYAMSMLYAWAIGYQYIFNKKMSLKIIGFIGTITIIYAIVMLGPRGGIVACTVAVIVYELYCKHYKKMMLMTLLAFIIMTYLAGIFDRFSVNTMLESGGAGRTDIWKVGIEMIKDNFLQGVGLSNFAYCYNEYARLSETGYSIGLNRAPHNFIIEIWAELGLIGLSIYSYIYYFAVKKYIYNVTTTHFSLLLGMLATFIAAFFLSSITSKMLWLLLAVLFAYKCQDNKINSV